MTSPKTVAFALVFILLASSCSQNDPSMNATRLRINLTDAATIPISEFNLEIKSIEVLQADSVSNNDVWKPLEHSAAVYDVHTLSSGKHKQLVDQYFPVGHLKKLKIVFGNNSSVKLNGNLQKLIIPEEYLDGIVLDVNASLYPNYITSIIVELNVPFSIREQNGNYFFRPYIRAFPETFGGFIQGTVLPKEAEPRIAVIREQDTLFTIPEISTGKFGFKGLQEGVWKIYFIADPDTEYKDTLITDTVFTGKILDLKT